MKNEIKEAIEASGHSYDEYMKNVNLSYIFATYAENRYMIAEDILRKTKEFRLTNKQMFSQLKNLTKKLLKRAEGLEEKHDEAFYSAVEFVNKLVHVTAEKELSNDDEIKIISYIRNNF